MCSAHEFGSPSKIGSLRSDVHAARVADVLVGTHGAGLTNAFFMLIASLIILIASLIRMIASLIRCGSD